MSTIAHWRRQFKSAMSRSKSVLALLGADEVERRCREAGHEWRESFWSPTTTLVAFLLQALNGAKTLRAGVAEILAELASTGLDEGRVPPSADPSAFCGARQRLPEAVLAATLGEATERIAAIAGAGRLWRGRRVLLIDGSSASMPDEAALQAAYPQPPGQSAGCGFPVMRLLAVFCWGTGALLEIVVGPLHDSEQKLFRTILDRFRPGDVALADRYYCSYVDIARLRERGADVVFRLHQRRSADFRQDRRLGRGDRLVTWKRPRQWLSRCGLTREEFERLPEEMALRMVRTTLEARGSRSRKLVVVTTILDPEEAPADDLLKLYRDRWMAELNLRSLKTVLRMETLRGRSVDVVRKEVLMHALLYNLIRLLMWEAARSAGTQPRRMSFAGTLHRLQTMGRSLLLGGAGRADGDCGRLAALLAWIAKDVVPDRPGRFEPRRVKRRPKGYSRLSSRGRTTAATETSSAVRFMPFVAVPDFGGDRGSRARCRVAHPTSCAGFSRSFTTVFRKRAPSAPSTTR
ncbi:MAG: IS4 family transposase [Phycisphaerales bacterium]|nr:IS4 family transposase [Phycisphaerales bacterium]